jgi:hypothetical protein
LYDDPTKTAVRLAVNYAVRNPPFFAQKIIEYSALGFTATTAYLLSKTYLLKDKPQEAKVIETKVPEIKGHHLELDFHDPPFLAKEKNLAYQNNEFKKVNNGRHFIYYVPRFDLKAPSDLNNLFTY